ncbi:serine/threonine protein phosphatase [Phyllobacterium brassicacearum]|uniref:Serine/threonine protein phosphatase n=1 Tax=Phyllobacterium brassicacearum TaxID=314235 RepID=A0A2P7BP62_9HYPH|nr:serine/threonine protein phosphatase [Phyllobacterium brassicacearum]
MIGPVIRLCGSRVARPSRRRETISISGRAVYVIGDVHGCLDELLTLERIIYADAEALPGKKLIILLGDYVDRGPASAQVVDHLIESCPEGFERLCLTGNHEMAMLDYLDGRLALSTWLQMGGEATLLSYGIDIEHLKLIYKSRRRLDEIIRAAIPERHTQFLRTLPILIAAGNFLFVHAGIRPSLSVWEQSDEDLVFIRSAFFDNSHLLEHWVIHGHTPIDKPVQVGKRFNLDTGAYFTGKLSALRLWKQKGRVFTTSIDYAESTGTLGLGGFADGA